MLIGDYLSAEDVEGGAALVARSIGHGGRGGIWTTLLGHSHHLQFLLQFLRKL